MRLDTSIVAASSRSPVLQRLVRRRSNVASYVAVSLADAEQYTVIILQPDCRCSHAGQHRKYFGPTVQLEVSLDCSSKYCTVSVHSYSPIVLGGQDAATLFRTRNNRIGTVEPLRCTVSCTVVGYRYCPGLFKTGRFRASKWRFAGGLTE